MPNEQQQQQQQQEREQEQELARLDARLEELRGADDPADIEAWFALSGEFDSAGFEDRAWIAYEQVFGWGAELLAPAHQPQLYLQAASTLRNLDRIDEARTLFEAGRRAHPDVHVLKVFQALLEITAGRERAANLLLLEALAAADDERGSISRYRRSLVGYTDALRAAD